MPPAKGWKLKAMGKAAATGKAKAQAKGKAKAKGKGKGKGKGKAKANAKVAQMDLEVGTLHGELDDPQEEAPKAKAKAKASGYKAKIFNDLKERSFEEVLQDARQHCKDAESLCEQAIVAEVASKNAVNEAQAEYEKIQEEVKTIHEQEELVVKEWMGHKDVHMKAFGHIENAKKKLMEEQKAFCQLEVLAENHRRMEELEATRRRAVEQAEIAKKNLADQKKKEKEALEATKQMLAGLKAQINQGGKGKKRSLAGDNAPGEASNDAD